MSVLLDSAAVASPEELEGWAWEDEGQSCHPSAGKASDYDWRFEPALPLDKVRCHVGKKETKRGADEWIQEEKKMDGGIRSDYYNQMSEWCRDGVKDPITVSLESDGYYYVWGGYHRHAFSRIHGHKTIPAIVGERK